MAMEVDQAGRCAECHAPILSALSRQTMPYGSLILILLYMMEERYVNARVD
jgi:hypothetical protein